MKLNYSLNEYTIFQALTWGNCLGHFRKIGEGQRIKGHLAIAIVEIIPIIGQVASFIELGVVKINDYIIKKNVELIDKIETPDIAKVQYLAKEVIYYKKGDKNIIPTVKNNILGSGSTGSVYIHRNNENHVVKKGQDSISLEKEFRIGEVLNHHPLFVKTHNLFVKQYENTVKHKLELERVYGITLNRLCEIDDLRLRKKTTLELFASLREGIEFLYNQGIGWDDVNRGNIIITKDGNIKICDYGKWIIISDKNELTKYLFLGLMQMTGTLIEASFLSYNNYVNIIRFIYPSSIFPNNFFQMQIRTPYNYYFDEGWFNNLKIDDLKNDKERIDFLNQYIDAVIAQIEKIKEPEFDSSSNVFTANYPNL